MGKALFVTGTGTDIGKTYITALIVKKLRGAGCNAGYYKAAMSGAEECGGRLIPGDAAFVYAAAGIEGEPSDAVTYVYKNAVSPHLAAQMEGNPVNIERVLEHFSRLLTQYGYLTMEGSGGIVCPIRLDKRRIMLEDIIKMLNLRCLITADAGLGGINAAVLTAGYMKARGLDAAGIILNNWQPENAMHRDNRGIIEQLSGLPVLCAVRHDENELPMNVSALAALYR